MRELKKNIDATILSLRNAGIERILHRVEETKARIEQEKDMAWRLASRVLAKVRSVRESLEMALPNKQPGKRSMKKVKVKLGAVKAAKKTSAVRSRRRAKK
jgi:hypothetical protein